MRPRYKVAYKMLTEMEWKCCHGYSGEDCNDGPNGGSDTQISTSRPWPRPQPGQTGTNTVHGQGGGNGKPMFSHGPQTVLQIFSIKFQQYVAPKSLLLTVFNFER